MRTLIFTTLLLASTACGQEVDDSTRALDHMPAPGVMRSHMLTVANDLRQWSSADGKFHEIARWKPEMFGGQLPRVFGDIEIQLTNRSGRRIRIAIGELSRRDRQWLWSMQQLMNLTEQFEQDNPTRPVPEFTLTEDDANFRVTTQQLFRAEITGGQQVSYPWSVWIYQDQELIATIHNDKTSEVLLAPGLYRVSRAFGTPQGWALKLTDERFTGE